MLLVIGSKCKSSWSLRPWLLLKQFQIPFEEKLIALDQMQTTSEILQFSPSARVPVLIDANNTIWDSLAIAEYLNEKYPSHQMWPADQSLRARARSISNEMHSGFVNMRNHMPHDLAKKTANFDWSFARSDIERVIQIWTECLKFSKGPFLFGTFSIADAMYAPVVNRFVTYGIPLDEICQNYVQHMRSLPSHQLWIKEALKESSS